MILGIDTSGDIMGLMLSLVINVAPWLLAILTTIVALYIFAKVKRAGLWGFVKTRPGDNMLLTKNNDGSGDLRKADYKKQDATIQDSGDKFDPFLAPSAEAGINFYGRRLFLAFRGLGSVQSMAGMAAARILKELGIKDGEDFRDWSKSPESNSYLVIPKAQVKGVEETVEEDDDGEEFTVNKVKFSYVDENGNRHKKQVSGLAVDLSETKNIAPYNVKSEQMGSIRARAYNQAMEKVEGINWARWGFAAITMVSVALVLIIIATQVLGGGGASPTESVGMVI